MTDFIHSAHVEKASAHTEAALTPVVLVTFVLAAAAFLVAIF